MFLILLQIRNKPGRFKKKKKKKSMFIILLFRAFSSDMNNSKVMQS